MGVYAKVCLVYILVSCHPKPATVQKLKRLTNEKTRQRFGKIKRAATYRTKSPLCSTFAFAPNAPKPTHHPDTY